MMFGVVDPGIIAVSDTPKYVRVLVRTSARTCGAASMVKLVDDSSERAFFATGRAERPNVSLVGETGPLSSSDEYPATRDMVAGTDERPKEDCYVIKCRLLLWAFPSSTVTVCGFTFLLLGGTSDYARLLNDKRRGRGTTAHDREMRWETMVTAGRRASQGRSSTTW
jgi:hypothetical protein